MNTRQPIRIATRKSKLALWQAHHVAALLDTQLGLKSELIPIITQGDIILDQPLALIGGKGLFLKEIEQALLDGRADIAVHSMKDVPAVDTDGLKITAFLKGEDPRDAFISHAQNISSLPEGAIVGTSSQRRHCQLARIRPDLKIHNLRGNVDTRLGKFDAGEFDGIILATAGLIRLKLDHRIQEKIEPHIMLPAVGQGVVGIQCATADVELAQLMNQLEDCATALATTAERTCNFHLKGSCQSPIGLHATWQQDEGSQLKLTALVGDLTGQVCETQAKMPVRSIADAVKLGAQVAEKLFELGAQKYLVHAL